MDADTSARFINSVVKSIQSVCHGYVEFNDHIKVIGHLYLSVDSNVNLNYIVNEQVCKNDRESSTMFVSNSYHSEPPSKKTVERDRRRLAGPRSKQDIRESETRVAVPSELGHVESDVMLFAAENFPSNSNTDSFQFTSQPHRPQGASKRKRTLSGGAELGAGGASAVTDVEVQIAGLIDQDLAGGSERTGSKARRLSEGDSRVPDNGQDVASFTLSEGGIPSAESGAGDWDVSGGPSTSNRDPMQESLSSRPGPSATITRAPSTDHSKDSNPPSRAPSTPSVKEEPQVDVDLTIVKEEEAPPSQSSCMQSGKGSSSQSLSGASNANYSSGQWDLPSHLQQQQQEMHSRVMRLDPNSSTVEYSSPPGASTSQAPDPGGLNMLDNAQLYPVMLHPNTATSQDIMSAVSMVEGRSMGQTLPSVMSFSNAGAIPSTSGHRMDMGPKPGGPRPGRLPRSMADQYGGQAGGLTWYMLDEAVARPTQGGLGVPVAAPGSLRGMQAALPYGQGGMGLGQPYLCQVCGRSFHCEKKYRRHCMHHSLLERFSCNVCGRKFKWKHARDSHMTIHTGIERFKCDICGRKFKWRTSLGCHKCVTLPEPPPNAPPPVPSDVPSAVPPPVPLQVPPAVKSDQEVLSTPTSLQ